MTSADEVMAESVVLNIRHNYNESRQLGCESWDSEYIYMSWKFSTDLDEDQSKELEEDLWGCAIPFLWWLGNISVTDEVISRDSSAALYATMRMVV